MAAPRFFADENVIGLGKALDQDPRYGGVVYPGHPRLPEVSRGSIDTKWLEAVGERGLIVITRDLGIMLTAWERRAWKEHEVRGFVLTDPRSQPTHQSLQLLEDHHDEIMELVTGGRPGPWMFSIASLGLKEIALE